MLIKRLHLPPSPEFEARAFVVVGFGSYGQEITQHLIRACPVAPGKTLNILVLDQKADQRQNRFPSPTPSRQSRRISKSSLRQLHRARLTSIGSWPRSWKRLSRFSALQCHWETTSNVFVLRSKSVRCSIALAIYTFPSTCGSSIIAVWANWCAQLRTSPTSPIGSRYLEPSKKH